MPRHAHHCSLYLLLYGMLFDLHSDAGWVEQRQWPGYAWGVGVGWHRGDMMPVLLTHVLGLPPAGGSEAISGETVGDARRLARVRGLATLGPVASVALACSPLQIDWRREPRPRRRESWRDLA
jgi:hypothetical protein